MSMVIKLVNAIELSPQQRRKSQFRFVKTIFLFFLTLVNKLRPSVLTYVVGKFSHKCKIMARNNHQLGKTLKQGYQEKGILLTKFATNIVPCLNSIHTTQKKRFRWRKKTQESRGR